MKRLLLAAICLSLLGSVQAQKDTDALNELQRSAEVLGISRGEFQTAQIEGVLVRFTEESEQSFAFRLLVRDQAFRWDVWQGTDEAFVTIIDGINGWIGPSSSLQPLSVGETYGRGIETIPLLLVKEWLRSPAAKIDRATFLTDSGRMLARLPARRTDFGQGSDELKQSLEEWSRQELFLDLHTGLPYQLDYLFQQGSDGRVRIPASLVFSEYFNVSERLFPGTITLYLADTPVHQLRLERVSINVPISEENFQVR